MDWATLGSVIVGGLIALIPVVITNRFQAKEHDKDRDEQRREAKAQIAVETKRIDIKAIEDAIDNKLKLLDMMSKIRISRSWSFKASNDITPKTLGELFDKDGLFDKLFEANAKIDKLAYSISSEFFTKYKQLDDLCSQFVGIMAEPSFDPKDIDELSLRIISCAGDIHRYLTEELILTRTK